MRKKTTGLLVCVVGIAAQASCLRTSQNALSSSGLDDDAGIDDVHLGAVPAEHVWSYGFGSADDDNATAVIALADGSVVVGGTIDTSYDDTGASTINVAGADLPAAGLGATGFVARIDATGAVVWSRSFAGTGSSVVNALALAPDGSVVVLGGIGGSIDLGDGAVDGGTDGMGFLLALTEDGTVGWSRLVDLGLGSLSQIAIDGNGNIYSVGQLYQGTSTTIDGIPLVTSTYAGVVVAFDPHGTANWAHIVGGGGPTPFPGANSDARPPGGTQNSWLQGVAVDSEGVVVGGMVTGDADLGAGIVPAVGYVDAMTVAYSPDGTYAWARRWGGMNAPNNLHIYVTSVALLGNGDVAAAGEFDDGISLDGFALMGGTDAFVALLDRQDGMARWARGASVEGSITQLMPTNSNSLLAVGRAGDINHTFYAGAFVGVFSAVDGSTEVIRAYANGVIESASLASDGDLFVSGNYIMPTPYYTPPTMMDLGGGTLPSFGGQDAFVADLRLPDTGH